MLAPDGTVLDRIEVGPALGAVAMPRQKRGPRALVHHPRLPLFFVSMRIAGTLAVIDTDQRRVITELMPDDDRTPPEIREGRGFLYDAKLSGNGTMSCASCQVDGTTDNLAWDLGDPGGAIVIVPGALGDPESMHPMKGPMVTQTLQGLDSTQPFHWRGDRSDLQAFNPAFDDLMGDTRLDPADLESFVAFMFSIAYMPNPRRNLDGTLPTTPPGASPAEGFPLFATLPFKEIIRCSDCHALDAGTNRQVIDADTLREPQAMKVAQLRNLYKRTGRTRTPRGCTSGFGLSHDGGLDDLLAFLGNGPFGALRRDAVAKHKVEAFLLAFDTGVAPLVGHELTLDVSNAANPAKAAELTTMLERCSAGDGDLVVHGRLSGVLVALRYDPIRRRFESPGATEPSHTRAELDGELAAGRAVLTFLGTAPGDAARHLPR